MITAILCVDIISILPNLQIPDIFVYSASDFLTVKNVKSYESKSDRSIVQNERSQSTVIERVGKLFYRNFSINFALMNTKFIQYVFIGVRNVFR